MTSTLDATAIIEQTLAQYGLSSLTQWAINEANQGASVAQITQDMTTTPQFKARFPAIAMRLAKGLPAISPADYITYEDNLAQMENQYGLPKGYLTNPDTVTQFLGNDVSTSEVQARVQQGYQAVAYAPPEVRQQFTAMFGASGDGALAAHFLDPKAALPLLEQQATAAQLSGTAAVGSINMSTEDAMKLAQMGTSQSAMNTAVGNLDQQSSLFNASIGEKNNLSIGQQGIESQLNLNQQATQQVIGREQEREAAFKGGGNPEMDQYGEHGAGAARPV